MTTIDLAKALDTLAYAVAEHGTSHHHSELEFLASEARDVAPAAAAALVDWAAPEVFRLRAFGVVHGVLLHQTRTAHSLAVETRRLSELYRLAA